VMFTQPLWHRRLQSHVTILILLAVETANTCRISTPPACDR
jgi:hypothetical protein